MNEFWFAASPKHNSSAGTLKITFDKLTAFDSKNSFLLLAFLLSVEGLCFFFFSARMAGTFPLASREKENVKVLRVSEKVKAWSWEASDWQKAIH